jgi:GNAT superfamily N-acetyltransferase
VVCRIAPIEPREAAAYNDLVKRGLREHPTSFDTDWAQVARRTARSTARGLRQLNPHNALLLGAFDRGDCLVGTGMIVRRGSAKQAHCADVLFVYVPIEHQGQGIAKQIMTALIAAARQLPGIEQLQLTVNLNGGAAPALYQSLGFQSIGVWPRAICVAGQYIDQVQMWLPLTTSSSVTGATSASATDAATSDAVAN